MDKQGKESADAEISWNDEIGKDAMWKILEFVTEVMKPFFGGSQKGLRMKKWKNICRNFRNFVNIGKLKFWKLIVKCKRKEILFYPDSAILRAVNMNREESV